MAEITEDMIGCLCWFWEDDEQYKILGVLRDIYEEEGIKLYKEDYDDWKHCQPVKPEEVMFYDYDDRYNCCAENEELRIKVHELESKVEVANKNAQCWFDVAREKTEENKKLKERLADASKTIYTHKGKKISASEYYQRKAEEE